MTHYFISRHQGAIDWIQQQSIHIDIFQNHLEPSILQAGDVVIGTLPINIVAQIQQLGVRYVHLNLELPAAQRGVELSPALMDQFGAKLIEYQVTIVE